jgi:hypothetical protein
LFAQTLTIVSNLPSNGFFRMVYEHFLKCFILKNPSLGFLKLFHVVVAAAHGDILRLVALVLGLVNC